MFSLSNISRYCLCKKKKKRNVVDNFPGILMDKMYHIVNILQTSEECFSSSNSIEIYCNGV